MTLAEAIRAVNEMPKHECAEITIPRDSCLRIAEVLLKRSTANMWADDIPTARYLAEEAVNILKGLESL